MNNDGDGGVCVCMMCAGVTDSFICIPYDLTKYLLPVFLRMDAVPCFMISCAIQAINICF